MDVEFIANCESNRRLQLKSDKEYVIHQDYIGVDGTGGIIWPVSVALVRFFRKEQILHKIIVDVGSGGSSIVAIAAHEMGASLAVSSDGFADCIQLCERNLRFNLIDADKVVAMQLRWGDEADCEKITSFISNKGCNRIHPMTMVASDCIFDWSQFSSLISTLVSFSHRFPNHELILAYQLRNHDMEQSFLNLLLAEFDCLEWNKTSQFRFGVFKSSNDDNIRINCLSDDEDDSDYIDR